MEVSFDSFKDNALTMSCPLGPNINDKHTVFGGSLAALATVCGWTFSMIASRVIRPDCEAMIVDSRMSFHAPGNGSFSAVCSSLVPDDFNENLHNEKKAKLELTVDLYSCEVKVASFTGLYIVRPKRTVSDQNA